MESELKSMFESLELTEYDLENGEYPFEPAIDSGRILPGYYVCTIDGSFWSTKRNYLKIVTPCGPASGYLSVYPRLDGATLTLQLHRIVAETLISFPRPKTISESDWALTPESVKAVVKLGYLVHHIDHDKHNFHPSNLEWVTAKENSQYSVINQRNLKMEGN
jgi:hypothetical protein